MRYRKLGKTDIEVSAIAMGCWTIGGGQMWGDQDEAQAIATVHAALDAGINFFDTAEGYGDSESVLGKALADRRDKAIIATKVGRPNLTADEIQEACEGSLRRLDTDYIDLYQIHWPRHRVPIGETMAVLEKLREQGKIRAVGVSNFGSKDLAELVAVEVGRAQSNQLPYSLLWRAIEYEIQRLCVDNGVSILCYSPLMHGLLTGRFASADDVPESRARTRHFSAQKRPFARHDEEGAEAETFAAIDVIRRISEGIGEPMALVSIAWLLHQPGVTSVLAGTGKPDQVKQNARAADLALPPDALRALDEATDALKAKFGRNPDMWMPAARSRYR